MSSPPFGAGVQYVFDQHQRFVRSGLKVYLRVKNFEQTGDYLEVGVPYVPTGAEAAKTGYTDYTIQPPPNVQDVSMHNIGMMSARLDFGARIFTVSNSFVREQMALLGSRVTDPYAVWRERDGKGNTMGLVYNGRMFDIVSITHREVSGQTISWKLICNMLQKPLADAPETIST